MTKTLKIKTAYADATTRQYTLPARFGDDSASANAFVANAKARAEAFNTAAESDVSSVAKTFVSETGARLTGIVDVTLILEQEEVIYSV